MDAGIAIAELNKDVLVVAYTNTVLMNVNLKPSK